MQIQSHGPTRMLAVVSRLALVVFAVCLGVTLGAMGTNQVGITEGADAWASAISSVVSFAVFLAARALEHQMFPHRRGS